MLTNVKIGLFSFVTKDLKKWNNTNIRASYINKCGPYKERDKNE